MRVDFTESALRDLEDIIAYYIEQKVPEIGERYVSDIVRHTETLPVNPKIGRMVPEFQQSHIRELIHAPFRIVYMLTPDTVVVIIVWRSERLLLLPE